MHQISNFYEDRLIYHNLVYELLSQVTKKGITFEGERA